MRYQLGKAIAEMTDSARKTAIASIVVGGCAAMLEVAAHTLSMRTGISEPVHTAIDASIMGIAVGVMAWLLFSATRARRRRVLENVRAVAELNHRVRNALQVIVSSSYVHEWKNAEAVLESAQNIDSALRELFPAIGERAEDRQTSKPTELRRDTRRQTQ